MILLIQKRRPLVITGFLIFVPDDLHSNLHNNLGIKAKSRKDLRKEKRQESKAKQHASWMKKRVRIVFYAAEFGIDIFPSSLFHIIVLLNVVVDNCFKAVAAVLVEVTLFCTGTISIV